MPDYEHEQTATLYRVLFGLLFSFFAALAVMAALSGNHEEAIGCAAPATILAIVLALFHSLTVRVSSTDISFWFGIGLIGRTFLIADIDETSIVRTRWYNGWGIRWIRGGWLYNIAGFDAIELKMKGGRRYWIGTDEPNELHAAIESARSGR